MQTMKEPEKGSSKQTQGFKMWGAFVAVVLTVFWVFSSGDFSFLLTVSSLASMFSFVMVAIEIVARKSVKGVSLKMIECYVLVFLMRSFAILPWEGYLPYDKSGDWLYQTCEVFCFCLSALIVYFCRMLYMSTYNSETDYFKHMFLIGPALAIALILHPHLNNFMPSDIAWAFALYLESVTVLPQLFMFMKEGEAQAHTSHFLAAQALSRIMSFVFWASSFSELSNKDHYIKQFVGNWVVVVQLLQLIIMSDFVYRYVRCLQQGISVSEVATFSCNV
jgi:hypothetical protein